MSRIRRITHPCDKYGITPIRRAVNEEKVILKDAIHGEIMVSGICMAIINTPQFSRLRYIRQLGMTFRVFMSAMHTRFEHSIGVMHLAVEFIKILRTKTTIEITQRDEDCLAIAGLIHDLGRGPFSNVFDQFLEHCDPKTKWKHQYMTLSMFDWMVEDNDLMPVFINNGLTMIDIIFIKELVFGILPGNTELVGRSPYKHFLYQIIANNQSGVDVDKFDYFQRDNLALQIGTTFHYKRYMEQVAILQLDGKNQLFVRDKLEQDLAELFVQRARLHTNGYQHRVVLIIDRMLLDALLLANPHLKFTDDQGNYFRMSECILSPQAYFKLRDDNIFMNIVISESKELGMSKARKILRRIEKSNFADPSRRDLYQTIIKVDSFDIKALDNFEEEVKCILLNDTEKSSLKSEHLVVVSRSINLGVENQDLSPLHKIGFFDKNKKVFHLEESKYNRTLVPEKTVVLLSTINKEDALAHARRVANKWIDSKQGMKAGDFYIKMR